MERRQHARMLIDGPAAAHLVCDGRPGDGSLRDVSCGGARMQLGAPAAPALERALRAGHPCRLEIAGLGVLTAVPRWIGRDGSSALALGASLVDAEPIGAPVPNGRPDVVPDAAMVAWIHFFARQALLSHLTAEREAARRARRRALQLAGSFIERGLQRVVVCGGDRALVDDPATSQRLEVADVLGRLGAWTGAPHAVLAAGMLRVVAHLTRKTGGELDDALDAYRSLAAVAEAPVVRWSVDALAAIAEPRVRARRAAASAALAARDFRGIVDPAEGFPAPSFVGVLSAALAVFSGGEPPARRPRASASRRAGRGAPPRRRSASRSSIGA